MPKQIQGSQTDFSFGEVDVALKRNDQHPARKAGLRQMSNARILNSGGIQDRSGRRALFPITQGLTRIEKFTMTAGNNFKIGFGPGVAQIISDAGVLLNSFANQGNSAALPWVSAADINSIVYAIIGQSIYITFGHGMRPQVISWDGVSAWTIADYAELVNGGQKRTSFYRITPKGIPLQPSAQSGNITVTAWKPDFSGQYPLFTAAWVGTRITWLGRQILITGFSSSSVVNATVEETLPGEQEFTYAVGTDPTTLYSPGDEVIGSVSNAKGIVINVNSGPRTVVVQLLPNDTLSSGTTGFGATGTFAFVSTDIVVGPGGGAAPSNVSVVTDDPQPVDIWDNEVMNGLQGYPASVFTDQFRVGFCNFPTVPGGIAWSAIDSPNDLYVDVNPDNAMFELVPSKTQVLYVVPGAESSEFVFCTDAIFYIPISPTNPLKPGSVAFQLLSSDGAAQVQPRRSQEVIVYANAGANSMMAVVAVGDYYRPFRTKNLSDFHEHLFSGIVAIAVPTADAQFNERYAYVLNSNGSLVCGKYNLGDIRGGTEIPKIGWGPWSGAGVTEWVAAWNGEVHFTSTYFGAGICERLDDTLYLDAALFVNALPTPFVKPGKGPLWFWAGQSVSLMDQVTRAMGTYQIDANGNIVPQNNGGENLAIASLVAGQPWTMMTEPFAPDAPSGPDMHQRMTLRQISNLAVYVINSTGFEFVSLFSAKQTPTSPPLGTIQQYRRVPAWNQGDDATKPPPLRETVETWPPTGSSFDPRAAIVKDVPGPLQILEIGMEISI